MTWQAASLSYVRCRNVTQMVMIDNCWTVCSHDHLTRTLWPEIYWCWTTCAAQVTLAASLGLACHFKKENICTIITQANTLWGVFTPGLNWMHVRSRATQLRVCSVHCHPSLAGIKTNRVSWLLKAQFVRFKRVCWHEMEGKIRLYVFS